MRGLDVGFIADFALHRLGRLLPQPGQNPVMLQQRDSDLSLPPTQKKNK